MQFNSQNEVMEAQAQSRQVSIVNKAYLWMCAALGVTGITSVVCASNIYFMSWLFTTPSASIGLIIAQLVIAIVLSFRITKMSYTTARVLFLLYAFTLGVSLSSIFLAYSATSIAATFFICSAMFGAMAAYGHFTKKDLSSWGKILIMVLVGLILATVVNIFLGSNTIQWVCSIVGVVLFAALTAYDANKIRQLAYLEEGEMTSKLAVMGAFSLYLDFVNLFLYLLRFFGGSRD